jgi:hypothetical protein
MAFNYSPKTVTDGLVLYLDAANIRSYASGSLIWNDLSKSQTSGSLINGPTFTSVNGGGIVFDGTNDNINIKSTTSTVYTANISWEFVSKPTLTAAYRPVFSKSDYTDALGYIAFFHNPNQMSFRINASDVAEATREIDYTFPTGLSVSGVYNHTVLTYDGSYFRLYQNGTLIGTSTLWIYGLGTNTKNQVLGTFWAGYWNGDMCLFKQYSKALSLTEIQQNFNAVKTRFGL